MWPFKKKPQRHVYTYVPGASMPKVSSPPVYQPSIDPVIIVNDITLDIDLRDDVSIREVEAWSREPAPEPEPYSGGNGGDFGGGGASGDWSSSDSSSSDSGSSSGSDY